MKLAELASTIRSKNAGVDHITLNIFFKDGAGYARVKASGAFTREKLAPLFKIEPGHITVCVAFAPSRAIKFTVRRLRPSGSPAQSDLFGAQQYSLLFDLEVP